MNQWLFEMMGYFERFNCVLQWKMNMAIIKVSNKAIEKVMKGNPNGPEGILEDTVPVVEIN